MQINSINAQFRLGLELIDLYRDTTSVSNGHFLFDLSPQADDRLRFCTNNISIPLSFFNPGAAETTKTQNLSTLQVFQSFTRKCQNLFPQSCSKELVWFLHQSVVYLCNGNLQTIWKHWRDLPSKKMLKRMNIISPSVFSDLFWHGAVRSRPCFCVQQECENPFSYKSGASNVSSSTQALIPNWSN